MEVCGQQKIQRAEHNAGNTHGIHQGGKPAADTFVLMRSLAGNHRYPEQQQRSNTGDDVQIYQTLVDQLHDYVLRMTDAC